MQRVQYCRVLLVPILGYSSENGERRHMFRVVCGMLKWQDRRGPDVEEPPAPGVCNQPALLLIFIQLFYFQEHQFHPEV